MDVERMSKILEAVVLSVPADDVCETPEEREFYEENAELQQSLAGRGIGLRPVNEFPDVTSPTPTE